MNKATVHQTFLRYDELLRQCADLTLEAEQKVRGYLPMADAQEAIYLEKISQLEHTIATTLTTYANDGPDGFLHTHLQYRLDHRPLTEPTTPAEAIDYLAEINETTINELRDQADKSIAEGVKELLTDIVTEIDDRNRRISMIRVTLEDL